MRYIEEEEEPEATRYAEKFVLFVIIFLQVNFEKETQLRFDSTEMWSEMNFLENGCLCDAWKQIWSD